MFFGASILSAKKFPLKKITITSQQIPANRNADIGFLQLTLIC